MVLNNMAERPLKKLRDQGVRAFVQSKVQRVKSAGAIPLAKRRMDRTLSQIKRRSSAIGGLGLEKDVKLKAR